MNFFNSKNKKTFFQYSFLSAVSFIFYKTYTKNSKCNKLMALENKEDKTLQEIKDNNSASKDREVGITKKLESMIQDTLPFQCKEIINLGIKHTNPVEGSRIIAKNKSNYNSCSENLKSYLKLNGFKDKEKFEKENLLVMKNFLVLMSNIINHYFEEISVEVNRNLDEFNFVSTMSPQERKEVSTQLINKLKELEKNVFIDKSENGNGYYKGNFFGINKKFLDYPNKFLLYKEAGVYNDWPKDRVVYKNKGISVIINDDDHVKFRLNHTPGSANSDDKEAPDVKISDKLLYFLDILDLFEKQNKVSFHNDFGYLNTNVLNSGHGMNFYLKLKIKDNDEKLTKIAKKMEEFAQSNSQYYNYDFQKIEKSDECNLIISNSSSYGGLLPALFEIVQLKDEFK